MNQYFTMREPIGTPAVRSSLGSDLYLSLMNIDPASQSAGLLVIRTPMVAWIWISVFLMGLGGVIALIPSSRRVYALSPDSSAQPAGDEVAVG